jgi:hypothetical protein
MDDWESHFRQKSRRRARRQNRAKMFRAGVTTLLLASVATAIYMKMVGL